MDPRVTFIRRFGDLIALLRSDPGNDAAQDLALTAAGAALEHGPVRLEVGEGGMGVGAHPSNLPARLHARGVEAVHVDAEADLSDLLDFARALAHDATPLPASPQIEVRMAGASKGQGSGGKTPPGSSAAPRPIRSGTDRRGPSDRRRSLSLPWRGLDRRMGGERRIIRDRRLPLAATDPGTYSVAYRA